MSASDKIRLGSGKLYIALYDASIGLPDIDYICKPDYCLGYIKGGASIEYSPSFYEAKDDLGVVSKSIITDEEVNFKTGLITFDGDTLEQLCDTSRVVIDENNNRRTVKFGGLNNAKQAKYVLVFKHEDRQNGNIWVRIVGSNQSGFELSFKSEQESIIDAVFRAFPMDEDGTLVEYVEEQTPGAGTGSSGSSSGNYGTGGIATIGSLVFASKDLDFSHFLE